MTSGGCCPLHVRNQPLYESPLNQQFGRAAREEVNALNQSGFNGPFAVHFAGEFGKLLRVHFRLFLPPRFRQRPQFLLGAPRLFAQLGGDVLYRTPHMGFFGLGAGFALAFAGDAQPAALGGRGAAGEMVGRGRGHCFWIVSCLWFFLLIWGGEAALRGTQDSPSGAWQDAFPPAALGNDREGGKFIFWFGGLLRIIAFHARRFPSR